MVVAITDIYAILGVVSFGVVVLFVEELGGFVVERVTNRAGAGKTVVRDIRATLRIAAILFVASNVLSFFGLSSLTTTLTLSGVGALVATLALQTTLSNVISALLLFSDGLLRLDDDIEYGAIRGTVVRVGLRNIWMKTPNGELAVVSNSTLSSGPMVNHTAKARLSKKYAFD